MSRMSNGSSSAGHTISNGNGHVNGHSSGYDNVLDMQKIGQACIAGLKHVSNDFKEVNERCSSLQQSVVEKLSEIDLRLSAVETSHQAQRTLYNDNQTLKSSIDLLSKSNDPAWKSDIEARLIQQDLEMKKLQEEVARLSKAKSVATPVATSSLLPEQSSPDITASSRASQAPVDGLIDLQTSNHVSPPPARPSTAHVPSAVMMRPHVPINGEVKSPATSKSFDREAIDRVLSKKLQLGTSLDRCISVLENLQTSRGSDAELDNISIADASALSQIDCKSPLLFRKICPLSFILSHVPLPVSVPLVSKTGFEHKRDWIHAWQQALEKVQGDMSQAVDKVVRKAELLHSREERLFKREQVVIEAGSQLQETVSRLQDECAAIAEVRVMQEDHEEELLKRLGQVEEREAIIQQDEYIIQHKGRRQYERDAAEYRRVQDLRALRQELHNRIQEAIEYRDQLQRGGRVTTRLPETDDLPSLE